MEDSSDNNAGRGKQQEKKLKFYRRMGFESFVQGHDLRRDNFIFGVAFACMHVIYWMLAFFRTLRHSIVCPSYYTSKFERPQQFGARNLSVLTLIMDTLCSLMLAGGSYWEQEFLLVPWILLCCFKIFCYFLFIFMTIVLILGRDITLPRGLAYILVSFFLIAFRSYFAICGTSFFMQLYNKPKNTELVSYNS